MTEIFTNIPKSVKDQTQMLVDLAFKQPNFKDCINMIKEYIKTSYTVEEQEFVDFYCQLKMEMLNNENHNDFSEEPTR